MDNFIENMDSLIENIGALKLDDGRAKFRPNNYNSNELESDSNSVMIDDGELIHKKKRKDCETNWCEFITACFYDNQDLQNADELLEHVPTKIQCYEFDKYKSKLDSNKKNEYYAYYLSLKNKNSISCENIRNIYLVGKCYKKYPNIVELNKNYNKKQTKGDIYIEYTNNQYVAISVKQSKECTDTNYSVYTFFNKEDKATLISSFDELLHQNGGCNKKSNSDRNNISKILHRRDNLYFNQLKLMIERNKNRIKTELYRDLYCVDLNYDIYKFNSADFFSIKKIIDIDTVIFEEFKEYYKTKKNKERKCAKLFYKLTVGDDIYRVEIRWKGNYSASPQFMCYLI